MCINKKCLSEQSKYYSSKKTKVEGLSVKNDQSKMDFFTFKPLKTLRENVMWIYLVNYAAAKLNNIFCNLFSTFLEALEEQTTALKQTSGPVLTWDSSPSPSRM